MRSVWAASRHNAVRSLTTSPKPLSMVYVGPAPYLAGLSCKEARLLLENVYAKPIRRPYDGFAPSSNRYWVDFDRTVVCLGHALGGKIVLDKFRADEVSMFRHVALMWYDFAGLARTCQRLAAECPTLCTIIVNRRERNPVTD